MNADNTKPTSSKVESFENTFSSVSNMGAFKQVSTRFDIASLTGSSNNKVETENRSLLELSRLMSKRNGDSQTSRNPRKRRFDIASLTGTSTDDDSRSPESPELDVVALDSCSSSDSIVDKQSRKALQDDTLEPIEDTSEPKNFSIPRGNTSDHGSAFRKIDKQTIPSLRRQNTESNHLNPSQQSRVNLISPESSRLSSNSVSSPVVPMSPHSLFVSQSEMQMSNKFPFQEDPFNYIKLSPEMKSSTLLPPANENRMLQHGRSSGVPHQSTKSQAVVPQAPPPPPTLDSFSTKTYQHPLLSFLPPSLAALSFPTQNWCAKCNATFRMTSDLVYHMRSHHKRQTDGANKKREEKLRCDICKESFRERHHLTRHMTSHQ